MPVSRLDLSVRRALELKAWLGILPPAPPPGAPVPSPPPPSASAQAQIQSLDRSCGYSGLMLPVCEDAGLAKAFSEGRVGITELLCLSSVCGIGIDTLPVPGNLGCKSISHILADTLALAKRWNKQLSCRLLPCPGKEAGEKTDFRSPYLVDATL